MEEARIQRKATEDSICNCDWQMLQNHISRQWGGVKSAMSTRISRWTTTSPCHKRGIPIYSYLFKRHRCLYHVFSILWQDWGPKNRTRLVALRKVAATVGMDTCRALIGLQAYTVCETVSTFAGKGKTRALTLLMNNKETQDIFLKLGQGWDLSPELSNKPEAFTCVLCVPKASTTMINRLRYHIFCAKKVKWRVINSHHARIAWGNTHCDPLSGWYLEKMFRKGPTSATYKPVFD